MSKINLTNFAATTDIQYMSVNQYGSTGQLLRGDVVRARAIVRSPAACGVGAGLRVSSAHLPARWRTLATDNIARCTHQHFSQNHNQVVLCN